MTRGNRNLIILGIGALLITALSTTTSLAIYRLSGDIYLDRSRPGYLPDQEEIKDEPTEPINFTFPDSGAIDHETLAEYLKEYQKILNRLENFTDPFAPSSLSDQSLGIPSDEFND